MENGEEEEEEEEEEKEGYVAPRIRWGIGTLAKRGDKGEQGRFNEFRRALWKALWKGFDIISPSLAVVPNARAAPHVSSRRVRCP